MRGYLQSADVDGSEESEDGPAKRNSTKQNVLLEQRVERARKAYVGQLDQTIESLQKKTIDLNSLGGDRKWVYQSLQNIDTSNDAPDASSKNPMGGAESRGPLSLEKLHGFMKSTVDSFQDVASSSSSSSSSSSGSDLLAPRRKLDSLLRSIRTETSSLADVRAGKYACQDLITDDGDRDDNHDGDDDGDLVLSRSGDEGEVSHGDNYSMGGSSASSVPSLPSIYRQQVPDPPSNTRKNAKRAELLNMVDALQI
jgi:hypothetical protein